MGGRASCHHLGIDTKPRYPSSKCVTALLRMCSSKLFGNTSLSFGLTLRAWIVGARSRRHVLIRSRHRRIQLDVPHPPAHRSKYQASGQNENEWDDGPLRGVLPLPERTRFTLSIVLYPPLPAPTDRLKQLAPH